MKKVFLSVVLMFFVSIAFAEVSGSKKNSLRKTAFIKKVKNSNQKIRTQPKPVLMTCFSSSCITSCDPSDTEYSNTAIVVILVRLEKYCDSITYNYM